MPRYQIEFPDNNTFDRSPIKPDAFIVRFSYHAKNTEEAWAIFRTFETFFTSQNYAYIEMQAPVKGKGHYEDFKYKSVGMEPTIESRCPHCDWIDFLAIRAAGTKWRCPECNEVFIVCDDCEKCNYRVACLSRDNYER